MKSISAVRDDDPADFRMWKPSVNPADGNPVDKVATLTPSMNSSAAVDVQLICRRCHVAAVGPLAASLLVDDPLEIPVKRHMAADPFHATLAHMPLVDPVLPFPKNPNASSNVFVPSGSVGTFTNAVNTSGAALSTSISVSLTALNATDAPARPELEVPVVGTMIPG